MEIKNLKKAADRIIKAIKNKEKIILYGDADLDGVTSVIILKESVQNLGGKIAAVYFPDREKEGYGLSQTGLKFLKKYAPALLITADCGIGNFREAKLAKKLGFKLIIIDHHEPLGKLPTAEIIIDPKQKGDKKLFMVLAAAGIVFKLSEAIFKNKMAGTLRKNFLELTALATLADMMPREGDNKLFIAEGLKSIEKSWRPGIKALFAIKDFDDYSDFSQKISKIISILNVRDVKNRLPAGFRLLTVSSPADAKKIVGKLFKKSKIRKEKIEKIIEEVEQRLSKETSEPIVFEGGANFELTLISSVAAVISRKYFKPTFLFKRMKKESQGTVRVPSEINSVALMKKCSKYLLTYGGHPRASGFRIKNENLEKFKKCLLRNYENDTKLRKK